MNKSIHVKFGDTEKLDATVPAVFHNLMHPKTQYRI